MFEGVGGRINFGDSAKWQYLHFVNGLPHGTGYPQYLFLTEIFSRIFIFLPAPERITLISVVFGALSLSMFYALTNLLTSNKTGSLLSTFLLGFTYIFWCQSTEPEVYTLNIFYILTVLYFFLKYHFTAVEKYFLAGCFFYALSFGNHLSMVTILPALIYILLVSDFKKLITRKNIILISIFIIGGALQYVFIYLRAHADYFNPEYAEIVKDSTFPEFLTYITGDKKIMFQYTIYEIFNTRIPVLLGFLNENFSIFGIILGFAGFFYFLISKKKHTVLLFILIAILGQIYFHINFDVADLIVFFLPVYVLFAIFIALIFAEVNNNYLKISFAAVTALLIYFNVEHKKILAQNTFEQREFTTFKNLYTFDDAPLYTPSLGRYDFASFIKYKNCSGELKHKQRYILDWELDKFNTFYIPGDFLPYIDTSKFNLTIARQITLTQFLKSKAVGENVIFISAKDEATEKLENEAKQFISENGGKIHTLQHRGSYLGILYKNQCFDVVKNEGFADITSFPFDPLQGRINYSVFSAGMNAGNESSLKIDGVEYSKKQRGLNILVYDLSLKKISDIISYDTWGGEVKTLFKAIRKN
jgi:hypothetical protein